MEDSRVTLGFIVIWVVPDPVTWLLVTSIVSTTELSDDLWITISPLSKSTASEKFKTILLSKAISVELSNGEVLVKAGATVSSVVNDKVVGSLIPA